MPAKAFNQKPKQTQVLSPTAAPGLLQAARIFQTKCLPIGQSLVYCYYEPVRPPSPSSYIASDGLLTTDDK